MWLNNKHYILVRRQPQAVDLMTWARWMEENAQGLRRVDSTETKFFWVSTVFLGLDHNWSGKGAPLLFESMAFEKEEHEVDVAESPLGVALAKGGRQPKLKFRPSVDAYTRRYPTWRSAELGHKRIVEDLLVKEYDAEWDVEKILPSLKKAKQ